MNRRLGAEFAAEQFVGAIGDHLVDVHVGLGAGAGLPDHEREVIVELAVDDLLRGGLDRAGQPDVEAAVALVEPRRRLLDDGLAADHFERHSLGADLEVLERALRLRAPVPVRTDLDRPDAVFFGARLGHGEYLPRRRRRRQPMERSAIVRDGVDGIDTWDAADPVADSSAGSAPSPDAT